MVARSRVPGVLLRSTDYGPWCLSFVWQVRADRTCRRCEAERVVEEKLKVRGLHHSVHCSLSFYVRRSSRLTHLALSQYALNEAAAAQARIATATAAYTQAESDIRTNQQQAVDAEQRQQAALIAAQQARAVRSLNLAVTSRIFYVLCSHFFVILFMYLLLLMCVCVCVSVGLRAGQHAAGHRHGAAEPSDR